MDDRTLNQLLDDWRVEPPTMTLRDRVMARAPQPRASWSFSPWLQRGQLWLAGAGLAAGVAGVSCGAIFSASAIREARDEALVAAAVSEGPYAASVSEPVHTL